MDAEIAHDALAFGQQSRTSHSEQPVPLGGVPRALREAAEIAGLDPLAQLYNEALNYAHEGHLRLARERLTMLLCMAPDDGEARLLLARVHVAGQRWQEAISALDEAKDHGQVVPSPLRRAVEDHLRAEQAVDEEHRTALLAREQGELAALRSETRRLRSEHAMLTNRAVDLERETRRWAWTTAGVATVAIGFVLANLIFGTTSPETASLVPEATLAEATDATDATAPASEEAATPRVAAGAALANRVASSLSSDPNLDGTRLEVQVDGANVALLGEVTGSWQVKLAETLALKVPGVDQANTERIDVLARTRGTKHTVRKGETLSHIARRYYGEASLSKQILLANKKLLRGRASNLQIGMMLNVPKVN